MSELKYDLDLAVTVGEVVDRLVTVQVAHSGGGSIGLKKPINPILYQAAREAQNNEPITYLAAKLLLENVKPGGTVVLSSGFFVPPYMAEEVDGTFGIAALARAIVVGIGATPIILTEDTNMKRMEWLLKAVGLDTQPLDVAIRTPHKCAIVELSRDDDAAAKTAKMLIDKAKPGAILFSEKPSRNVAGVYHNGMGLDLTAVQGKADTVLDVFKLAGIASIGVGDGGNEIGMGLIAETAKRVVPTATACGCSCGQGIAASSITDVLVVAASANWGCYGIEAVIAAALGIPEVLHNKAIEERITMASVFGGLVDPSTGMGEGWTDGTESHVSEAFLTLLDTIVTIKVREKDLTKVKRRTARSYPREDQEKVVQEWAEMLNGDQVRIGTIA